MNSVVVRFALFISMTVGSFCFLEHNNVREYEDWRHNSNDEMIEALKEHGHIASKTVENVMRTIDRRRFIERPIMNNPYWDVPQSLGYGSVMSSPKVHAQALEILKDYLKPGARVLDIGSGSGYLTACMAHLVGPTGKVYAIEHIDELISQANKSMHTFYPHLIEGNRVNFIAGDGRNGYRHGAPYEVIYVGGAVHYYPFNLVEHQLNRCGRIYIPIGLTTEEQNWETIDKFYDGEIGRRQILKTAFPYLKDADKQMRIHLANFIYPC